MFVPIEDYMERSFKERQLHLDLESDCIKIGGQDSRHYRGLLAHFLGTTIPAGMRVHLCHACNEHGCSNPRHLYWGTATENAEDTRRNGMWTSPRERTRQKYGDEKFAEIQSAAGRKGGKANLGKQRITEEFLNAVQTALSKVDLSKRGWVKMVHQEIDRTPQYTVRLVKKYFLISCDGRAVRHRLDKAGGNSM